MMHILELCWRDGGGKDGGDRRGSVCRIGSDARIAIDISLKKALIPYTI